MELKSQGSGALDGRLGVHAEIQGGEALQEGLDRGDCENNLLRLRKGLEPLA